MVDRFVADFASQIAGCFPGTRDFALDYKYETDDESELGLQALWLRPQPKASSPHPNVLDISMMMQQFERVYRLTLGTAADGTPQVVVHGRYAEEEMMVILSPGMAPAPETGCTV